MNIVIDKYDHEGRGIGYLNNKLVFVSNTIVGEEVEIEIIKNKKKYSEGKVVNYIKKSNDRIKALCPFYEKCGGCDYQHIDINQERSIKHDNFKNILKKYASLDISPIFIESNTIYNYRNKITLKIKDNKWGYYNNDSHDFVCIDNCLIAKESINNVIKDKDYIDVRDGSIIIRSNYNDEIIIKVDTNGKYNIDINSLTNNNKIIGIIVNDKLIFGQDFYFERIGGYLFKVNINSFFQVNLDILTKVFIILNKNKYNSVVDLYCGVGTLGIALDKDIAYGIEIIPEAIKDAIINNKLNKQNNLYMLGDSSKVKEIKNSIDTIIIDPPRSGLNQETLKNILDIKPQNIIYMSCNILTLARDLNVLKRYYEVSESYIFEMFPNTHHVESVALLCLKDT